MSAIAANPCLPAMPGSRRRQQNGPARLAGESRHAEELHVQVASRGMQQGYVQRESWRVALQQMRRTHK